MSYNKLKTRICWLFNYLLSIFFFYLHYFFRLFFALRWLIELRLFTWWTLGISGLRLLLLRWGWWRTSNSWNLKSRSFDDFLSFFFDFSSSGYLFFTLLACLTLLIFFTFTHRFIFLFRSWTLVIPSNYFFSLSLLSDLDYRLLYSFLFIPHIFIFCFICDLFFNYFLLRFLLLYNRLLFNDFSWLLRFIL